MAVDILRPRTWIPYQKKNCRGCFAGCCTLPVRVDSEDLFHMGFITSNEVNGELDRLLSRLKKQGVVRSFNRRTQLFTLKRHRNSDCVFLDANRRCTIYEKRPFVCRSFPDYSARPGFCPCQPKSK